MLWTINTDVNINNWNSESKWVKRDNLFAECGEMFTVSLLSLTLPMCMQVARYAQNAVKIRDSALGLSGFVSFFWWAYMRRGLSKENL